MTVNCTETTGNRIYKSSVFIMLFEEKEKLLELYNAVSGKHYENPEDLVINTLENAIYMSIKNDISFIIDSSLSLYEHQSTYNPNLPLRYLYYVSDIYSKMTINKNIYGRVPIRIPAPHFVIFYNGEEEAPDREYMCLSDLYITGEESPDLELKAVMLNIRPGHNPQLMEACSTLKEYSEFVEKVRNYTKVMELNTALDRAVTECIQEGILTDFLRKNRAEVIKMSLYEYDQEQHMKWLREEGYEQGHEDGKEDNLVTNIQALMKNMNISVQQAMEVLEVPKEKYKVYEEKLKNTKDKKIDKGHL